MVLNSSDFWECPVCLLQGHTARGVMFALFRERATGSLRERKATDYVTGYLLSKAKVDEWHRAERIDKFLKQEE